MTNARNSKPPCKSPDFLNGSSEMMGRTALETTHDTHRTVPCSKRTQNSSTNNLSASFNTLENTGNVSKVSAKSFMKPTRSSRSKFTVR